MSGSAARGAAGWLCLSGLMSRLKKLREKQESAAPRVSTLSDASRTAGRSEPAARAPVIVYKRRRRVEA
jgi:hypothetical protein